MNFTSTALMLLLALAMAACASDDEAKTARLCPQTAILREIDRVHDYGREAPDEKNLVGAALIQHVEGGCHYSDEGVDVDFTLGFKAARGPRLGGDRLSFPFFVAVLTPDRKIVSKEMLTEDFIFHGESNVTEHNDTLHVFIPLAKKNVDAGNYQILSGFQLTEEQIKEIRKTKDNTIGKAMTEKRRH